VSQGDEGSPPLSGLARSLRERLDQVVPPGVEPREGEPAEPEPSTLPPGVRDRFTTRIALYLGGDEERREALRPGLRDDVELLEEAEEEGPLVQAALALARTEAEAGTGEASEVDPILRRLEEYLSFRKDRPGSPRRSP